MIRPDLVIIDPFFGGLLGGMRWRKSRGRIPGSPFVVTSLKDAGKSPVCPGLGGPD